MHPLALAWSELTPSTHAVLQSLAKAQLTLETAGIELDARWGDIQYAERNGRRIPIPGGQGWAGMFGMIMAEAAYEAGDEWLDALLSYLDTNRRLFAESIAAIPGLSMMDLEATYLAWVDFAGTGMTRDDFTARLRQAGLAPSEGHSFGPEGESCMRFNLACRHALLAEATERLADAFSDLQ